MAEHNIPPQELQDDISLKDILNLVKEYFVEIVKSWKLYFILPLLAAAYFFYGAYAEPIYYPASVTFQVAEESGGGGAGGLSSIIAAFGGGRKNEGNLEKILQLFSSRRIINNTLFKKTKMKGRTDYLANHIITTYGLDELIDPFRGTVGWIDQIESLDSFRFNKPVDSTSTSEEFIMNSVLYSHLTGNPNLEISPMIGSQVDEKSNIMRISMATIDEDLTLESVKVLYNQLSSYYIDNTIEKTKKIKEIAQYKRDSISTELAVAERKLAEFEDGHRNLVWVRGELEKQKLQRKARILEVMYTEVMRQLEMADFEMRRKTPYVSFIDMPVKPITPIIKSTTDAAIKGFISVSYTHLTLPTICSV